MSKKIFFIILIIIIILVTGLVVLRTKLEKVIILTDKTEYQSGGILKVNIKNRLAKNICFASCYPYLLERKNGEWKSYNYQDCHDSNLVENCISALKTKAFEVTLPSLETGLHRIAVPVCIDCKMGEEFKENKRFYSNEFTIKEKKEVIVPQDKESCEALGGVWEPMGPIALYFCNLPTSDAGKECSDSAECEESCIAELSEEDLDKAEQGIVIYTKGKCTAWKITGGCEPFVTDGKVKGILCVD